MSKKVLVLMFLLPFVILIGLIFRATRSQHRHEFDEITLADWKSSEFISIRDNDNLLDRMETRIKALENNDWYDKKQRNELTKTLYRCLLAYSSNKFEAYKDFRLPIKTGDYDTERIEGMLSLLNTVPTQISQSDPEIQEEFAYIIDKYELDNLRQKKPEEIIHVFWEVLGNALEVYCTNCWEGVSIESIDIKWLENIDSDKSALEVNHLILENPHVGGATSMSPFFNFSPSRKDLLLAGEKPTVAFVSFIVKDKFDDAYPVYLQCYWYPNKEIWLPEKIGFAYWNEKEMFLF